MANLVLEHSTDLMVICFALVVVTGIRAAVDTAKNPIKELAHYYTMVVTLFAVGALVFGCMVMYEKGNNPSEAFLKSYSFWCSVAAPIRAAIMGALK